MDMRKPKVFRCYRCGELRNGKPKLVIGELQLCQHCHDESQGKAA